MGQVQCYRLACKEPQDNFKLKNCPPPLARLNTSIRIGAGINKINCQDKAIISEEWGDDIHIACVLDGFGPYGKEASDFVSHNFLYQLELHKKELITHETDKEYQKIFSKIVDALNTNLRGTSIDCSKSGTCFHAVILIKNIYYTINIGNSKSLLTRGDDHNPAEGIELTVDHELSNQKENERIAKVAKSLRKLNLPSGTEIGDLRYWLTDEEPGFAVTRGLGGYSFSQAFIYEPDIVRHELSIMDKFIVLATDGLWKVMKTNEVSEFLNSNPDVKDEGNVAEILIKEASSRWAKISSRPKEYFIGIGDDPKATSGADDIAIVVIGLRFLSTSAENKSTQI